MNLNWRHDWWLCLMFNVLFIFIIWFICWNMKYYINSISNSNTPWACETQSNNIGCQEFKFGCKTTSRFIFIQELGLTFRAAYGIPYGRRGFYKIVDYRSLGAFLAPTFGWGPFGTPWLRRLIVPFDIRDVCPYLIFVIFSPNIQFF